MPAFADLRAEQKIIMDVAKALYKRYKELKLRETQKKYKDPCEAMEFSGKTSDYTEDREETLKRFCQWMLESAFQIKANFVNPVYDQKRLRRVVDVINKIKVCLTTPLGIETEDLEEDRLFLGFMTTNKELIDLGWKMQTQKQQKKEEEEEEARQEEEEREEDLPPQHGYKAKLRKLGGRSRGTSATPTPIWGMHPQGTLTPNQQKKKSKRQEGVRNEVEEVLIQDGAKVGKDPDAHTRLMAEVGCYSDRENKTLMGDIDAVKERMARDQEEKERLEKEREELERQEEDEERNEE